MTTAYGRYIVRRLLWTTDRLIRLTRYNTAVEVRMKSRSSVSFDSIRRLVHEYIYNNCAYLFMPDEVRGWQSSPILQHNVERIAVCDSGAFCSVVQLLENLNLAQYAHQTAYQSRSAHYKFTYTNRPRILRMINRPQTLQSLPKNSPLASYLSFRAANLKGYGRASSLTTT